MYNGHLLVLKVMMAFSIENSSEGRPYKFQSLIFTASPRVLLKEKAPELGIFFS